MRTRRRAVKAFAPAAVDLRDLRGMLATMSLEKRHDDSRVKAVREFVAEKWADFRARSRFVQAKAAMVAAYLLVVGLTLLLAPPDPEPWEVKLGRIPFGIAFKSFIEIKNVDAGSYDDLVMEVDGHFVDFDGAKKRGTWKKRIAELDKGQKIQLWPEDLRDMAGRAPANTLIVEEFRLLDDDNEVVLRYREQ